VKNGEREKTGTNYRIAFAASTNRALVVAVASTAPSSDRLAELCDLRLADDRSRFRRSHAISLPSTKAVLIMEASVSPSLSASLLPAWCQEDAPADGI
jgi:hypothetical protein